MKQSTNTGAQQPSSGVEPTTQAGSLLLLAPIPHASASERLIVGKLVTDLLAAGLRLTVQDGEEEVLEKSTSTTAIFAALGSSDLDRLICFHIQGRYAGTVLLIWGNDVDVISDYSVMLEDFVAPANALAEELDR